MAKFRDKEKENRPMTDIEINEAVARKLGWKLIAGSKLGIPPNAYGEAAEYIPDYCHSIEAAWEIVEHLKEKNVTVEKGTLIPYMCAINWAEGEQSDYVVIEHSSTAPMAICLAFLKLESK